MTGQTGNMVLLQIKETYESLSNSEKQVAGVQPGDSKGVIWALLLIVFIMATVSFGVFTATES